MDTVHIARTGIQIERQPAMDREHQHDVCAASELTIKDWFLTADLYDKDTEHVTNYYMG